MFKISKQLTCQKFIYKLHSSRLRKHRWRLTLPIEEARRNEEVISLADSQTLRWIDYLNDITDADAEAKKIKEAIQNRKCKFCPYLGTNDHFADIEYLGVEEAQPIKQDDYRIDSFMVKDNIEFIEKNSRQLRKILSEDEIESYSRFKYEEA